MTSHTTRHDQLPWGWAQKTGSIIEWLAPGKNFCISTLVLTCCWAIIQTMLPLKDSAGVITQLHLPDGLTALVTVLLGINAAHSGWQAHVTKGKQAASKPAASPKD